MFYSFTDYDYVLMYNRQQNEETISHSSESVEKIIEPKKISQVWSDFTLITLKNNHYVKCKHCSKRLLGDSSNDSIHLTSHMNSYVKKQMQDDK